ncbi:MAG: ZIP family metal transporter [Anaeroplasmataceae bacterium]
MIKITLGILIPFIGTVLGASFVLFFKKNLIEKSKMLLNGFASGIMVAASIWSLLIPAINDSSYLNKWAFLPATIGFILGILFLFFVDKLILSLDKNNKETKMLVFAVTLHNIPEGMAVGAAFAGFINKDINFSIISAFILAIGIGIQNIPEGAIISMPLYSEGDNKLRSWLMGVYSGIVEPIAAVITLFVSRLVTYLLPYILSFAASAMLYVVVLELIPSLKKEDNSKIGIFFFSLGFLLMMILDITLS